LPRSGSRSGDPPGEPGGGTTDPPAFGKNEQPNPEIAMARDEVINYFGWE
jgi:hypothetical protein